MAASTRIVRRIRPEVERREEARAEPAQDRIALGRRDEDVLIRHVGDGPDDGQHVVELLHADLAFDHGDAVLSGFLGVPERGDGAAEQDQRLGDIAPRGLETPLVAVPRPAEQGAHVFLEHGERRVGEPGFEAGGLDHEDRRPPRRFEIGDVLDGHDRPFVDQPGEAGGMDSRRRARGRFPARARIRDDPAARRCWRGRATPNSPAARRSGSGATPDRPPAISSSASRSVSDSPSARVSKVFFRARARAAKPIRSNTAAAGSRTLFARRWASIAWTMGSPRSVAHAASAPTRRAGAPIGKPEAPNLQEFLEFDQMLPARLAPASVITEQRGVDADLFRDKGKHRRRRRLQRFEHAAGIAERAKLDSEAQAIGRAPFGSHENQVFGAE